LSTPVTAIPLFFHGSVTNLLCSAAGIYPLIKKATFLFVLTIQIQTSCPETSPANYRRDSGDHIASYQL
jgi:hypothetical protein